jgi:hypothetical protein
VSGEGIVAEGIEFSDGSVCIRWKSATPSTVVWASLDDAMKVHGHDGATEVLWLDSVFAWRPTAGRVERTLP